MNAPALLSSNSAVRLRVKRAGKWGFLGSDGEISIPCQFADALGFDRQTGIAQVAVADSGPTPRKLWGCIDVSGRWVIPAKFDEIGRFDPVSGMAPAKSDEEGTEPLAFANWGLIRKDGSWAVERRYSEITEPSSVGVRGAELRKGPWGLLDEQGGFNPLPDIMRIRPFLGDSPFLLAREKKGGWGLVDARGAWKLPPEYGNPENNSVRQCTVWWMSRLNGRESKPNFFADGTMIEVNVLTERRDPVRWNLVNSNGEVFPCPPLANENPLAPGPFTKGKELIYAETPDGRAGLLRPDGTWLHAPVASKLRRWSPEQKLIVASLDGRQWGWLDFAGAWVLEPRFDQLGLPHPDTRRAFARKDGRWWRMDVVGKDLEAMPWSEVGSSAFSGERMIFPAKPESPSNGNSELWGLAKADGSWAMEPRFSDLHPIDDGNQFFWATTPGDLGGCVILDRDGNTHYELHEKQGIRTSWLQLEGDGWIALHLELYEAPRGRRYRTLYIHAEKRQVISME